jgi:hypothetical protein
MNSSLLFRIFVSIVLILGSLVWARAEPKSSDALSQLEKAMRKEIAQNPRSPDDRKRSIHSGDERTTILYQLRSLMERGEKSQVEETLRQVLLAFSSAEVSAGIEKLRAAVQIEREAREKALIEKMEALLEQTRKSVQNAHKAAELDGIIRDLSLAQEQREVVTERMRSISAQLQSARQFVTLWQDYLDHRVSGRTAPAQQSLQNALNHTGANIVPRSEILERLAELNKKDEVAAPPLVRLREIMDKAKTLADLPAAIDAVRDCRDPGSTDRSTDPAAQLYEELTRLNQCYKEFRAGLPTIVQVRPEYPTHLPEAVELALPLKVELLRLAIPRFLRVDEKPATDEAPDAYVERMMRLAFDRCDPRLIQRVHHVQNAINGISNAVQLSRGLDALLAARNQEDAGQFLPAVISYQKALRFGGELVPADSIGRRLAAIKVAHPEEYEAGMKEFLEQPDPEPPYPSGANEAFSLRVPASDPGSH